MFIDSGTAPLVFSCEENPSPDIFFPLMPELAVIVPTFNERENVEPLAAALDDALRGVDYEVIFVDDDSPDGTAALVRQVAQGNPRIRVLHRVNRRGLASATIEGMLASSAPYLAVIDGDMQHDERILPQMLALLKEKGLDIVIGSRNAAGGSMGEFSSDRVAISQFGRKLSQLVCRTEVSDPMSGFFLLDRRYLEEVVRSLSSTGFKILLDLIATSRRPVRLADVGYTFRTRQRGASKLDILVGLEYLQLLLDKLIGDWIPVSFLVFALVGGIGVLVTLFLLYILNRFGNLTFPVALGASSLIVMTLNFLLNNQLTFRTYRLRGKSLLSGLLLFYFACSIGFFEQHSRRRGTARCWSTLVRRRIRRYRCRLGVELLGELDPGMARQPAAVNRAVKGER